MIYLDANVIIRFVEGDELTRRPIQKLMEARRGVGPVITSQFSRLECRTKPIRTRDQVVLDLYDRFFTSIDVRVIGLATSVVDEATRIRADYRFKAPDALHLATAVVMGATYFLTGDRQLAQFNRVQVELV